jgi:hypothetical protein
MKAGVRCLSRGAAHFVDIDDAMYRAFDQQLYIVFQISNALPIRSDKQEND